MGSSISVFSFWLRMPGHEGAVPGSHYRQGRVPWVGRTRAVAPCLLCEVLAVILVLRSGVALALALAWLLLRDCGSLGPRFLLPGLWWRCRSGLARSCSPGRFPASVLVPGPWVGLPRLSPSIRLLPLGRFEGFGFGLHFFGNGLPVLSRNSCRTFPGNLSLRLRLRLIPSPPRAPCIFMPGLCRKRGWECWSGSSSTSLRAS